MLLCLRSTATRQSACIRKARPDQRRVVVQGPVLAAPMFPAGKPYRWDWGACGTLPAIVLAALEHVGPRHSGRTAHRRRRVSREQPLARRVCPAVKRMNVSVTLSWPECAAAKWKKPREHRNLFSASTASLAQVLARQEDINLVFSMAHIFRGHPSASLESCRFTALCACSGPPCTRRPHDGARRGHTTD